MRARVVPRAVCMHALGAGPHAAAARAHACRRAGLMHAARVLRHACALGGEGGDLLAVDMPIPTIKWPVLKTGTSHDWTVRARRSIKATRTEISRATTMTMTVVVGSSIDATGRRRSP